VKILLGTKNEGKIREIKEFLALTHLPLEILTYKEKPFSSVKEDGASYLENALKKARRICQEVKIPVLSEDSGLEVEALGGKPGIFSSSFAGEDATDSENIKKLLDALSSFKGLRKACFYCVAVLHFPDGGEIIAEGELQGKIASAPKGEQGFGYDPVFIPEGFQNTLAELGLKVKNKISHRRKALEELMRKLQMLKLTTERRGRCCK
jgi:XTP/dITP diphosphohydrolase